MIDLYGRRGYKAFVALLGLQWMVFGGLAILACATPAEGLLAQAGPCVLIAAFSLFTLLTWEILAEAGFCLGLLTWGNTLRYQLRPVLLLAPLCLLAGIFLHHLGISAWLARLPLLLISIAGLVSSTVLLATVGMLAKESHNRDARRLQVLKHVTSSYGRAATQRIADSLAYRQGRGAGNPFQMKRGFMLADLPSTPWHSPQEFPWVKHFEQAADAIQAEALKACGAGLPAYQYPGAVQGGWNVFWLVRGNAVTPEAEAMCPATVAALRQVGGFPFMREAHFSVLQPRSRIRPHCDESNTWVTAHLGIMIPEQCGIRVGRESRKWEEKKFLFFDTSYEHEAWNDSDSPRIVLLFDFLHPRLAPAEQEFLMQMRGKPQDDLQTSQHA